MDWEEAMEEAREELGYSSNEYVKDWNGLVETAKYILDYNKQEEYDKFCEEAHYQHKNYLNSDKWKKLRFEILKRDDFTCQDCGDKAKDVHHLDYNYLGIPEEAKFCISLCRNCHQKRHNIPISKCEKKYDKKYDKKGVIDYSRLGLPKNQTQLEA